MAVLDQETDVSEILFKIDGMIVTWMPSWMPIHYQCGNFWKMKEDFQITKSIEKLVNKFEFNASINLLYLKPLL